MTKTKHYTRISALSLFFGMFLIEVVGAAGFSNMVGYWTFDNADLSGNNPLDVFGENDGTTTGATTGQTGQVKEAFSFDGDDYVELQQTNCFDGMGYDVTYSFWVYLTGTTGWRVPFSYAPSTNDNYFLFIRVRDATNIIEYHVRIGGSANDCFFLSSNGLSPGQWYYIAVVTTNTTAKLYINGVEETFTKDPLSECSGVYGFPEIKDTADRGGIGALLRLTKGNYFNGLIDEVAISSRTLTSEEIEILYNNGLAGHGYCYQDIGLRVFDGTQTVAIAVELGTLTSPLRITKDGVIYGIALVDPSDSHASKLRVKITSGIKALRKL